MTLKLLQGEHVDSPAGTGQTVMGYDRICKVYQRFVLESHATSRAQHKAGMSIEVDYSGPTMEPIDPVTGMRNKVYLFVACLPFSRYAFVEATLDMKQASWLRGPRFDVRGIRWFCATHCARELEDRRDQTPFRGRDRAQ